jgi:hypothetical protein
MEKESKEAKQGKCGMILIIGEHHDVSTDKVCAWLNYYVAKYVRTNTGTNNIDIISNVTFNDNCVHIEFNINDKIYDFDDFETIWCRRGYLSFSLPNNNSLNLLANKVTTSISNHLDNEVKTLETFIEYMISLKSRINTFSFYNSNKLIALQTANKVGLNIPQTLICQDSIVLRNFILENKACITKNIQDNLSYHDNNYTFGHVTSEIMLKDIQTERFFYSLFQNKIEKKYELRIFYLLGDFYVSATISPLMSNDPDIRSTNKTNRYLPFCLPKIIKEKLHAFMLKMKLESGSIDVIVDKNNDYWFLEVNPVAQFDFISDYCGKNIESDIFKFLSKKC